MRDCISEKEAVKYMREMDEEILRLIERDENRKLSLKPDLRSLNEKRHPQSRSKSGIGHQTSHQNTEST